MNTWLDMWSPFPNLANLAQNNSPVTTWFPYTVEYNFAGNRDVESDIVANVASYGRQLGRLTDAVLELGAGDHGPAMTDLRELAAEITERKDDNKARLEADLTRKLDRLGKSDPELLRSLLRRYASPSRTS